jgi:hypothetical protein
MSNTTITIRSSGDTGATPSLGVLANGELAINYADGVLYYKTDANTLGLISQAQPSGLDTELQYNDGGSFGASANLTFDGVTLSVTEATVSGNTRVNGVLTLNANTGLIDGTTTLTTTTADQTIDSFLITDYRSAKYIIQATDESSNVHVTEILLTHDDTTVYMTEYATIYSGGVLFTANSSISSGSVLLTVTPSSSNTTFDFTRTSLFATSL